MSLEGVVVLICLLVGWICGAVHGYYFRKIVAEPHDIRDAR